MGRRARDQADTWEGDGVDWVQRLPAHRPPVGGGLAYDVARRRAVRVGQGGTWEWDGNDWQFVAGGSFVSQSDYAMAYDEVRARVVLLAFTFPMETWEWDGAQWTRRLPAHQPKWDLRLLSVHLHHQALALDPAANVAGVAWSNAVESILGGR